MGRESRGGKEGGRGEGEGEECRKALMVGGGYKGERLAEGRLSGGMKT